MDFSGAEDAPGAYDHERRIADIYGINQKPSFLFRNTQGHAPSNAYNHPQRRGSPLRDSDSFGNLLDCDLQNDLDSGVNCEPDPDAGGAFESQLYQDFGLDSGILAQLKSRYPLHSPGININGRLPCVARRYRENMEEEATQPFTQPFEDPRRQGTNSMLTESDEADIIAVLHPSSVSAHTCVKYTAAAAPQHILQNQSQSQVHDSPFSDDGGSSWSGKSFLTQDIALRFSSRVYSMCSGFYFGRTPLRSDIILCGKENWTVSSRHFRIFVNKHGILMLEDTSVNGTIVDNIVLRGPKANVRSATPQPMITLHHGAVIELPTITSPNGESVRFIVGIPSKDNARERYHQNLLAYLACIAQMERRAAVAAQAGGNMPADIPAFGNMLPPGIPPHPNPHGNPEANLIADPNANPNASTILAATGGSHHGLAWNGGEKYNVVGYLDKGAFAMVYKLSSKRDGEVYAVKQLEKRRILKDGQLGRKGHNELDVMETLRHPNIVQYIDSHETDAHMFIIMEFVPCGDLKPWTSPGCKPMPEYMVIYVARQMLDALEYLHNKGITHRDIKPDNILMASHYPWVFKLSDFGLSKIVNNEETFLKTFCGTLLYLAPEVFPGYTRVKAGLSPTAKRGRGSAHPPTATLPYRHSVDIWSLGAVLYQLLTGHAPYAGNAEEQGAAMLVTVMNTPVDYSLLTCGGVSDEAVDFLSRMLLVEPALREREAALLQHPWLLPKSDPVDVSNNEIVSSQAANLDASQLSLADEPEEETDGLEYDEDYDEHYDPNLQDSRVSKRAKDSNYVPENYWITPSGDAGGLYGALPPPPPPPNHNMPQAMPDLTEPPPPPQPAQRLFGEIGSSALQSSGVLGENAHAALEVSVEGSSEDDYPGGSYMNQIDSMDFAMTESNSNAHLDREDEVTPQNVQYPQTLPGPAYVSGAVSLLGAEAQIGQLNMASPESGASASGLSVDDDKHAEPKTPTNQSYSPTLTTSKRPSQALGSNDDANDSKRTKTDDTNNAPPSSKKSQVEQSGVASHVESNKDDDDVANDAVAGQKERDDNPKSQKTPQENSQDSNSDDQQDGQQLLDAAKSQNSSMPATASNSQNSIHESHDASNNSNNTDNTKSTEKVPVPVREPSPPSVVPFMTCAPFSGIPDGTFAKPPIRFGNLIPLYGSIKTVPKIKITQIGTTYGRASDCHFRHQNPLESRVPKYAIDIQMFYPNIYKDLYAGRKDWFIKPELTALISTRTNRYIKINGVRLMKGEGCWLYGKLKTGDIISVFELPEGQIPKRPRDKDFLRFRCEFFVGASREVRADGEYFVVKTEQEKFNRYRESKSREGSMIMGEGSMGASGVSMEGEKKKEPEKETPKSIEMPKPKEKEKEMPKPDIPPRPPTPAIKHATLPGFSR